MADDAHKTLLHPFETGLLDLPPTARVLAVGARAGLRLPAGFPNDVTVVQGFRPDHLALAASGLRVVAAADGQGYDAALVLSARARAENEANLADAIARVVPGGLVVVAGAKTDGIASLRKRAAALVAGELGSASKHHGMVLWLRRPDDGDATRLIAALDPGECRADGFVTAPGAFSADGVDPASLLLADHLPADLKGKVADFAAGWGYLSVRAAAMPGVRAIDLYESSNAALEAAKINLAGSAVPIAFYWHDLLREPVDQKYDAIVMNPPFHTARAAEPEIGQQMIERAAMALKRGGRLFMVANRTLPYEDVMARAFDKSGEIVRDNRFKVLWGSR